MTPYPRSVLRPLNSKPSIGIIAPRSRSEIQRLEDAGATSFSVGGHVASPNSSPEVVTWLARLVEQTSTAVIGTAALILPLYPPALLAKQLADLDRASSGRLAIGVGVGGEYESDFAAVGVAIQERGARTDESLSLLRAFWSAEPVSHNGPHYRFKEVRIHPAPLQAGGPPLFITGRKPVAMRRAARLGDGWMPYLYSAERYAESVEVIRNEANLLDRKLDDFLWSAYLFVAVDDDAAVARNHALTFFGTTYRSDYEKFLNRVACVGTFETVTAKLQAFCDAGAGHLVLVPLGDDTVATAERLLREVVPQLAVR